ncbi:MAG: hypothetical protein AAFP20_00545 [Cyanobacteria bacterium J06614_10]
MQQVATDSAILTGKLLIALLYKLGTEGGKLAIATPQLGEKTRTTFK